MKNEDHDPYLISHMTLRKLLGSLGFLMPFILVIGVIVLKEDTILRPSISDYYYSGMRDVFVSILAAFGLFLFTYRGYESPKLWKKDNLFTNAAGVCAILVALFPTDQAACPWTCKIHFGAAVAFFAILSYISLVLFTRSNKDPEDRDWRKVTRNRIYRVCGATMIVCLVILAYYFLADPSGWPENTVFIFEALALWAFGISWLVKGEAVLGDK